MTLKLICFVGINILSFLLMGWDKYSAIKHYWRVPENSLIGISLIGGALGTLLGMILFHHKTKKTRFLVEIPLCIIENIYLLMKL